MLAIGFGSGLAQLPTGRLLRRSARPEGRPALFAAQFALSHACWLVTYPLAGRFGAACRFDTTFLVMAARAALGAGAALRLWQGNPTGCRMLIPTCPRMTRICAPMAPRRIAMRW